MTGDKPIDSLYLLLVIATFMMLAWILEAVWRHEKRGIIFVLIFPPVILFYILKYWEETRARCFFTALLMFIFFILGGLADYNFIARILLLIGKICIWPYYLYTEVLSILQQ